MSAGGRKMTPRGQVTRGTNSGPAVMMMPNHVRVTFMPNPPLKLIPPIRQRRKHKITGVLEYLDKFETSEPTKRVVQPTPATLKKEKQQRQQERHEKDLLPLIEKYRNEFQESGGDFMGMNCYNTLFVGRLAYEVTERKLLREMETFGPVKDLKLISSEGKSRGYAFVEYEHEEDMKRAYRAADGMKIEGRDIVVDVERGHTVPTWLPRRLGGGLGGTRLGGKDKNIRTPGRFNPNQRPSDSINDNMIDHHHGDGGGGGMMGMHHMDNNGPPPPMMMGGMGRGGGPPPPMMGGPPSHYGGGGGGRGGGGPPPGYGGGGGYNNRNDGPPPGGHRGGGGGPPPPYGSDMYGGGPPPPRGRGSDRGGDRDRDRGGGDYHRHERGPSSSSGGDRRRRSSRGDSAERGRYAPRPRY